jgi:hypothetical protein
LREILLKIYFKAIKRRSVATPPPMDILQRATLINSAMVPLYSHVLMALLATEEYLSHLKKEILSLLWNRTDKAETVQTRLFVAV